MVRNIIIDVLYAYLILVVIRVVLSYFPINPWSSLAKVVHVFEAVTDPVIVPVRRFIPPLRIGSMGIDLSPIIVIVALEVIIRIVAAI